MRLEPAADGTWTITVDGTQRTLRLPLVPATLIVRLWHNQQTGVLRGSLALEGSPQQAPLHTNGALIELLQAWLFDTGHTTEAT